MKRKKYNKGKINRKYLNGYRLVISDNINVIAETSVIKRM